jgi:conjugal transfer pilus assembly protein TraF
MKIHRNGNNERTKKNKQRNTKNHNFLNKIKILTIAKHTTNNEKISAEYDNESNNSDKSLPCKATKLVREANTVKNAKNSILNTPISSLILSLFIKAKHLSYLILFLLLIFVNKSFASHQSHCDLNFGYHFYCDDGTQTEEAEKEERQKTRDYKLELEQTKKELETKKAKAVVEPNEENVKEYMLFQKKVVDNSSNFADVWRRVLWKYPELDYTVKHPTNTLAKHKQLDVKREDIKSSLLKLGERYGLFFVYKSTCQYCHKYSPILKEFSKMYNIDILPITLDNAFIDEWRGKTITDLSVLKKLGLEDIKQVPATVLYDNKNKQVLPVGYGILSISDLEDRIYLLINQNGYEGF